MQLRTLLVIGGIGFLLLAIIGGVLGWQSAKITRQEAIIAEQYEHIGEVTAANAGLAVSIKALQTFRAADDSLILEAARKADDLADVSRNLDRRLKEAMRHAKTINFDAPMPVAVTDALCLRYLAASGRGTADHQGDAASGTDTGTGYTPATRCDGWRGLTARQAAEWLGLMIDHAGKERLDKAALRDWAQPRQTTTPEGSTMGPSQ